MRSQINGYVIGPADPNSALSQATRAWRPADLGASLLWEIDPHLAPVVIVDNRIESVADSSTNAAHAVAPSEAQRPLELTIAFAGGKTRRAMRCDGSTVCLRVGTAANADALVSGAARLYLVERVSTASTVYGFQASCQSTNTSTGTPHVSSGGGVRMGAVNNGRNAYVSNGSAVAVTGQSTLVWTRDVWAIARHEYTRPTLTIHRNGSLRATATETAAPPSTAPAALHLGAGGNGAGGAGTASGPIDFGWAALVRSDLSIENTTRLHAWLLAEFGLVA